MTMEHEVYIPHVGWLGHAGGDEVALFLNLGWYEYREQAFLWRYLRPGDTVIDCGAHFGLFSVLAARAMNGVGRVVAVEPNPESAQLMERNLQANGITFAKVVLAAVSARTGEADFYVGDAARAAYGGMSPEIEHSRTIQVETVTLDSLCRANHLTRVDFLKIDVEGSEIAVPEGASECIASDVFAVLMVEFSELNLRRAGASTKDLFGALESRGYTVCRFDEREHRLVPQPCEMPVWYDNYFGTKDVCAVNERLARCSAEHRRIADEVLVRGRDCLSQHDRMADAVRREEETRKDLEHACEQIRTLRAHLGNVLSDGTSGLVGSSGMGQSQS